MMVTQTKHGSIQIFSLETHHIGTVASGIPRFESNDSDLCHLAANVPYPASKM